VVGLGALRVLVEVVPVGLGALVPEVAYVGALPCGGLWVGAGPLACKFLLVELPDAAPPEWA